MGNFVRTLKPMILLPITLALLCSSGHAEPRQDPLLRLTLKAAIKHSLRHSTFIKDAHYQIQISDAQLRQARSAYLPRVSITAGSVIMEEAQKYHIPAGSFSLDLSSHPTFGALLKEPLVVDKDMEFPVTDQWINFGMISLMQPLFTGGMITGHNKMARQGLKIAKQGRRLKRQEVIHTVVRRYNDVIFTGRLYSLAADTLIKLQAVLKVTTQVYKAGSQKVNKIDFLKARMMVSTVENYVAQMKQYSGLAREGLKFAMGLESSKQIKLAQQDFPLPPFNGACEASIKQAQSSRPEESQLESGINALRAGVDVARSRYLPDVAFMSGYMIDDKSIRFTDGHTFYAGLFLNFSLFEGLMTRAKVAEARARLHQLENKKNLLKQGISLQVRKSYMEMERTRKQVEITSKTLADAEEYLRVSERGYQAELVELDDLLQAQVTAALLQAQHLKARYDLSNSLASLHKDMGDLSVYTGGD